MAIIDAAVDERDLYAQKGLRFEKFKGKRAKQEQRSLRLTDQWRLIVTVDEDDQGNSLTIIDIEDYH
ncbi:MAG: type II toxin-antitoxin system RelE/ParE family toxin [Desmonostoc vinosum HA7617-LM4]|jgi:proteic killer suppression protein|nr:type II toxin-antitoxin system RelE/ParE family toxin [Desmonostoc vinosum HA7617-LM4]